MANDGDWRVHLLINLVLSSIYATVVVYGASLIKLWTFTPGHVAGLAVVIFIATYLVSYR